MDAQLVANLHEAIGSESQAMIRCLVAAEEAVEDGRFNIAKVMRAAAHTARLRAMHLQRLLAGQTSPPQQVEAEHRRRQAQREALATALVQARRHDEAPIASRLLWLQGATEPLIDILERSVASLRAHRDVMENTVAQEIHGCRDCGYMSETDQFDTCPQCGALGGEFERFGPFYSATDERLGRRRVEEIVTILQQSPDALTQALDGVSEAALRQRPTTDEWCMKEIAGHMLDVTEIFLERARRLLEADTTPSLRSAISPWKVLEGKGYPEMASTEILERFRAMTDAALARIHTLSPHDWVRQGLQRGKPANLLDVGTWLANHNIAHLKQIVALRELFLS